MVLACAAGLQPAAAAAADEAPLTATDVRRVALASVRGGVNARLAGLSVVQQARAAGVPVHSAYLEEHPEVAAQVPLAAPSEAGRADKFTSPSALGMGRRATRKSI